MEIEENGQSKNVSENQIETVRNINKYLIFIIYYHIF